VKAFFSEEKKQKTFIRWARTCPESPGSMNESFFGSFFSKKELLAL
jgi:hypothetical protein